MPARLTRRATIGGLAVLAGAARAASLPMVRMSTAHGEIDILLHADRAPLSAADFLKYVAARLYDGGAITRVVRPDNDHGTPKIGVVQGGIRDGAKPWAPIALETTRSTGLRHRDGTISLPRDGIATGSGSEFFICLGDQPSLDFGGTRNHDGQGFAAFGQVVTGMDTVRKIWRMDGSGKSDDAYTDGQMLRQPVVISAAHRT